MLDRVIEQIRNAGIEAFRTEELIKPDIKFSNTENLERYIGFCKNNRLNTVFYRYQNKSIKRKFIDIDTVIESIEEYYEYQRDDLFGLPVHSLVSTEEFKPYIENLIREAKVNIREYNKGIETEGVLELEEIELYCLLSGKIIGITIDNNADKVDIQEETEETLSEFYKQKARACLYDASAELRRENRRREEKLAEVYNETLIKVKEAVKADPVFREMKTKQEKYRYVKGYYDKMESSYKPVATKVSFREMIDDAIYELEKERSETEIVKENLKQGAETEKGNTRERSVY